MNIEINIKDTIIALEPEVQFVESEELMVIVPAASLHELAQSLKESDGLCFDYLRSLTGMDWEEEGLG
ncbi:MAG: NADH-quinone oxidoreductase subunit C, partial [Bacteroidaceae bacterium]